MPDWEDRRSPIGSPQVSGPRVVGVGTQSMQVPVWAGHVDPHVAVSMNRTGRRCPWGTWNESRVGSVPATCGVGMMLGRRAVESRL